MRLYRKEEVVEYTVDLKTSFLGKVTDPSKGSDGDGVLLDLRTSRETQTPLKSRKIRYDNRDLGHVEGTFRTSEET